MSPTTDVMASRLATSSVQAFAVPPFAAISAATARVASALISVTATLAPSAAKTSAVARPMPLAAPVTRAVRPLTERLSALKSDMEMTRGNGADRVAGLTRLAPIRRQVKPSSNAAATVANISALQIRRLEAPDAVLYKDIRLEALQRSPEAFGSTFEWEN